MRPGAQHAATLYAKHLGRPVIVVGGGPSTPGQLASVLTRLDGDPVYIFANGHGFKLGLVPDYIVCKDDTHTQTKEKMEPLLRAHGPYPIVTRHPWGDFIMDKWPTQGNSGQLAIALGALIGGKPVIPVGIDCYQKDQGAYFHAPQDDNVSFGRRDAVWRSSMTRMMLRLEGALIRPVDGPMRHTFKRYDPTEALPDPVIPSVFGAYRLLTSS